MELKKNWKINEETDDYGRDKRPEIEKLRKKEITITESREKTETKKKKLQSSPSIREISPKRCQMST